LNLAPAANVAALFRRPAATWQLVFVLLMLTAGYVSIAASQLTLGVSLLLLLYRWVFRHEAPAVTGLEKTAALLALWALVMIPFSSNVAQSAVYYRRFYLFAAIWVAASCATTEKRRLVMLAFLLGGALVTCLHDQVMLVVKTGSLFRQRMEGNFNLMTSGCLLMMAALTAAGFLVAPGTRRRLRLALALSLVPLLLGLVMIMTRSAQVGLLAGVGMLLLVTRPRIFAGFAAALAVVVVVIALQGDRFPTEGPWSRFNPQYLTRDPNTTLRLEMWRGGWEMVKRHPLTGVGDRGLEEISPDYYTSTDGYYFGHLHSNIPHMAAIWGVPGLLFGQAFVFAGLWYLLRRWRALRRQPGGTAATPAAAGWVLGAIAVWAGFYVAGLTEWYFGDAEPMLVYLAILGVALGPCAGSSRRYSASNAAQMTS
jgi:O-antigen ligase